jgi:tetratricopeptide (TPR) repeat protein
MPPRPSPQRPRDVSEALVAGEALLASDPVAAAEQARQILSDSGNDADAFRLLGAALRRLGDVDEANHAELAAIQASAADPKLAFAGKCLIQGHLPEAEKILRDIIHRQPGNVAAIRMLGEIAARFGHHRDAEEMFRDALSRAPGFDFARLHLASSLHAQSKAGECLEELDKISVEIMGQNEAKELRASALGRVGEYEAALELYRQIVADEPNMVPLWTSIGFLCKVIGDEGEAVAAYRKALVVSPASGEAWYGLADMKTVSFSDIDVAAMERAISSPGIAEADRFQIEFALAKAYDDRKDVERSFARLRMANSIRAAQVKYDPERLTSVVDRSVRVYTRELMEEPGGSAAHDPIFILGLPRSGSTLVEQILGSHPLVEGTAELPDVVIIAQSLEPAGPAGAGWIDYPLQVAGLDQDELKRLGDLYLKRTSVQRKTRRPFFIDKMPNNWVHTGLIKRILPNAKIVDVRRSPMACGFSNFQQHYSRGQEFSYDLGDFGRYYRDYLRLMRHFDEVMPAAVHRVIHEKLVEEPETEIRRLLDYLDLEFDEACLRFHESARPVRTASALQVRQPINRHGTERWRTFEQYLAPLKEALGPALKDWQ